jgi:CheY-like chemotaxis protein
MPGAPDAKRVLIVEDDAATQQLIVALLRRDGYEGVVASDGKQAIEALQAAQYAVVILDLMMPKVGGGEVIDFLEAEKRGEKVIVCTAAGPRLTSEIRSDLVKAVLRKPFDIDALMAAVTSVASAS